MRPTFFIVFLVFCLLYGCNENNKIEEEISKIELDLNVSRFDEEFAQAQPENLADLKQRYPYLFPEQYPDSIWEEKLKDTVQRELFLEVQKAFPDFSEKEADLTDLFRHIAYYFPSVSVPKVVTLTSDVQYDTRVVLVDSLLLLGLDNYLGSGHHFYERIPKYIATSLESKFLVSDVASAFANKVVPRPKDRSFLAQMIYYGKQLYLKDKLMPNASDPIKIGYSQEEFDWAVANEEPIWRNFIEQEHLYSTDRQLAARFLDPAPFSKFGLELIDNESPGRIGRYIGWQIVRSFTERNEVAVQELLSIPAEELFKKSNFKPQK
ncbi:gliding motility lipoprotein GldB [Maribacter sp. 2307UL18-2]|uniref:gliding motility lipoprotein GldB n=1 Tax=Maribacter sp. 2307UL18-2 TaxID=3386274 RepID=UPI0039BC61D0